MKVFEVNAGWEVCFCETREDAQMVADDLRQRHGIIGVTDAITIEEVEIYGDIPESERRWVEELRASRATPPSPAPSE